MKMDMNIALLLSVAVSVLGIVDSVILAHRLTRSTRRGNRPSLFIKTPSSLAFPRKEPDGFLYEKRSRNDKGFIYDKGKLYFVLGNADAGKIMIGRGVEADICISSPNVSRIQASLSCENGRWLVEDMNSSNGTMVNGQFISRPFLLRNGDSIRFGDVVMIFQS